MKLTSEKLTEYRKTAVELGLNGLEMLALPDADIIAYANGIGCESMPQALRTALDTLHPSLVLPSIIHDLQWEFSDGTEETFHASNDDFEANGKAIANAEYGWYNPVRYLVRHKAAQFHGLLELFGWKPYRSAYEAHQKAEQAALEAQQGQEGGLGR